MRNTIGMINGFKWIKKYGRYWIIDGKFYGDEGVDYRWFIGEQDDNGNFLLFNAKTKKELEKIIKKGVK